MPVTLPKLEDFVGKYDPSSFKDTGPSAPAAPAKPRTTYASLTPQQRKEIDLQLNPRSALGEIGAGLMRGLTYELPKTVGQALQAPGKAGDTLFDWGTSIQDYTKDNEAKYLEDPNEEAHNIVTRSLAQGAGALAPSLAPLAALPLLAAAPAGVALAGTAALGAALFGGSQFTETYDKMIKAGKTPEQARQAGLATGAVEGLGEAIATPVLGSALKGGRALLRGAKVTPEAALTMLQNPKAYLPELAKLSATTMGTEVTTEMGQAYGETAIERQAGLKTQDPYEAAVGAIGPTMGMTTLLGPLAAFGLHANRQRNKLLAQQATVPDPSQSTTEQLATSAEAGRQLQPELAAMSGKDAAQKWRIDQLESINKQQVGAAFQSQQNEDMSAYMGQVKANEDARQAEAAAAADAQKKAAALQQAGAADVIAEQRRRQAAGLSGLVHPFEPTELAGREVPPGEAHGNMSASQRMALEGAIPQPRGMRTPMTAAQYTQMFDELLTQRDVHANVAETRRNQDAATAVAGVAAARTDDQHKAAVAQVIVNPPEGAMTFPQFVAETHKNRQAGGLQLTGGRPTRASLEDAYVGYINNHLYGQEQKTEEAGPVVSERQKALGGIETPGEMVGRTGIEFIEGRRNREAEAAVAAVQDAQTEAQHKAAVAQVKVNPPEGAMTFPQFVAEMKKSKTTTGELGLTGGKRTQAGFDNAYISYVNDHLQKLNQMLEAPRAESKSIVPGIPEGQQALALPEAQQEEVPPPSSLPMGSTMTTMEEKLRGAQTQAEKQQAFAQSESEQAARKETAANRAAAEQFAERAQAGKITGNTPLHIDDLRSGWQETATQQGMKKPKLSSRDKTVIENAFKTAGGQKLFAAQLGTLRRAQAQLKENSEARDSLNAFIARLEGKNAVQVTGTKGQVSRTAEAGQAQPQGGEGVRQGQQGYEAAVKNASAQAAGAESQRGTGQATQRNAQSARVAQKESIVSRVRRRARDAMNRMGMNMRDDFLRQKGKSLETLNKQELEEMQLAIDDAVDNSVVYRGSINKMGIDEARYSAEMNRAVVSDGSVESVLRVVESSPHGQRMQPLVDRFRALGLQTKFISMFTLNDPVLQEYVAENMREADRRGRSLGAIYYPSHDVVVVINDYSIQTAMHELVHAATEMRLKVAEEAEKIPEWMRSPKEQALVDDLEELRELFDRAKKVAPNSKAYGFTDIHEFLAESNTTEEFQRDLKEMTYKGVKIWQQLMNWVRRVLGRSDANFNNALEHALDLTIRFENPDLDGLPYVSRESFDAVSGPVASMTQVDQEVSRSVNNWYKAIQGAASKGNIGQRLTRALLQAFSTWHIKEWIAKSPTLQPIAKGIADYFTADSVKTNLIQSKSVEFHEMVRAMELALQKVPDKQAMLREISVLAGEMSGLNVDLNMGYVRNTQRNPNLERTASMRTYVDDLHRRYMALPQNIRTPLEQTFALNRKNFIQQTTTTLRNYLEAQRRTLGPTVDRWISRLNILDPTLTPANPGHFTRVQGQMPYYADLYTKNLDQRLQAILTEVRQANIGGEFDKIAEFYSSAVKNPYQHLGRTGNNFVEFNIRAGAQALAQIQQVLSPFNVVIGEPAGGNRHVFMRFETPKDRDDAFNAVKGLGYADADGLRGGSLESRDDIQNAKGVPDFARSLHAKLDASFDVTGMSGVEAQLVKEMHDSIKRWALDSIPETSARKALVARNVGRTLGYDADFVTNYTTRATSMTSQLANSYTLPMFDKAFAGMKTAIAPLAASNPRLHDEAQMIHDEMAKRFANGLHPVESPLIDLGKAFGYNFYLGLSPAFWIVNLGQPWHLTLPYLGGHFGFVRTARAMGNASAKALAIIKNSISEGVTEGRALGGTKGAILGAIDAELQLGTLSPGEAAFVRAMAAAGHLDSTQGHELGRAAAGTNPKLVATNKFMSAGSHYTEIMNRLTSGLAGYNLELKRSDGDVAKATERGLKAVGNTQFGYSDANVGRAWGRHGVFRKWTPLLASFQQYSFQTNELLLRMVRDALFKIPPNATEAQRAEILLERHAAQKGLVGIMGTTTVLAGTLGLPFANVAARLTDALIDALKGDDDDKFVGGGGDFSGAGASGSWGGPGPSDIRSAYRSWVADLMGKEAAEIWTRGVPRAFGFDISARAGLQDLLPGSRFFTDRRELMDQFKNGVFNMMGPAVSAGAHMATGISHMFDGRIMDGLVEALPLALSGPAKAIRMNMYGYTNATGNQLPMEVTNWDEFVQTVGFTPSKKAEQAEVNYSFKTRDMLLKQQKNRLSNDMYLTVEREGALEPEQMQELVSWNTRFPEYKIDLKAALKARAKARGVAEVSGTDIAALPRFMSELERYRYANTQ